MHALQGLGDWLKKAVVCITWGAFVDPALAPLYTPLTSSDAINLQNPSYLGMKD
jgi:hypothetical protein